MGTIRSHIKIFLCISWVLGAPIASSEELFTVAGTVSVSDVGGSPKEDRSNVVVFLDSGTTGKSLASPPTSHSTMVQKNMVFSPVVLPIVVGATVDFPNEDVIFHNVFSRTKIAPFDLGYYKKGRGKSVKFLEPGLVKVYCNIHSKMVGYILVLPTTYFGTTSKEGVFHIQGVPKGSYQLTAWQRFGDAVKTEVAVGAGAAVSLALRETGTEVRHKNKWGMDFDDKY